MLFPVVIISLPEYNENGMVPTMQSATLPQVPTMVKGNAYCSVKFGNEKPCICVSSLWPDTSHRMYHSNLLARLARKLVRIVSSM
jgi:hypothetical protein